MFSSKLYSSRRAAKHDWWPAQEEPTLQPSCLRSPDCQKFSSQSFTVRSSHYWLGPSCPKLRSSMSSKLKLVFNLEMKFPKHQGCTWDEGNGNMFLESLRFQGEVERYLQSRLIPCSGMRLQMAICFLKQFTAMTGRTLCLSPCGSAGQPDRTASITQGPALRPSSTGVRNLG